MIDYTSDPTQKPEQDKWRPLKTIGLYILLIICIDIIVYLVCLSIDKQFKREYVLHIIVLYLFYDHISRFMVNQELLKQVRKLRKMLEDGTERL